MVDKVHHIHVLEREAASFRRKEAAALGLPTVYSQRTFSRENSVADSSLGYSTDEGTYDDKGDAVSQMFVSTKDGARRILTSSGQQSASQGHDGGTSKCVFAPANSNGFPRYNQNSKSTPNQLKKRGEAVFSSPTMVSTDISSSETGTPSTPPPRHVKNISADDDDVEVWYQKWWMCGFTDALNLNSN